MIIRLENEDVKEVILKNVKNILNNKKMNWWVIIQLKTIIRYKITTI
jgi:hypothetical protein